MVDVPYDMPLLVNDREGSRNVRSDMNQKPKICMNHNYRQARRSGYIHNEGYHIALTTILEERGLTRKSRLRDNVDLVREALTEMTQRRILAEMKPYDERLTHATTKGRPKIVEAVWMLYPSAEFVDEVVIGNR